LQKVDAQNQVVASHGVNLNYVDDEAFLDINGDLFKARTSKAYLDEFYSQVLKDAFASDPGSAEEVQDAAEGTNTLNQVREILNKIGLSIDSILDSRFLTDLGHGVYHSAVDFIESITSSDNKIELVLSLDPIGLSGTIKVVLQGSINTATEELNTADLLSITIEGVKVGPSPEWLQERLLSIGLKPINNVVDISNFVLFETGQPLHTFDADKVRGGKVIVRRAAEGEPIRTLDGVERKLAACDMVIADAEGPMCIAGVFGGEDSGVSESTVNVFIEGAYFDPVSISKTAKSQTLSTDASFRFERGADPEAALYAAKRAALLILEVAGGKVVGKVREVYPEPIGRAQIDLDYNRIEHFIGKRIGHGTIEKILEGLNYQFLAKRADGALVAAPTYMVDVTRECDVVEEILRIYGYNNIELPQNLRMSVNPSQQPDPEATRNAISNWLAANGFVETMNNSLTKEDYYTKLETFPASRCVYIVNPLSQDLNVMRQTLLLNGLEVVAYNLNRQATSLRFFEYGSVYQRLPEGDGTTLASYEEHRCFSLFLSGTPDKVWRSPAQKSNFFQLKGYVEALMARYRIDVSSLQMGSAPADLFSEGITYSLPGKEPKLLATLGCMHPVLCKRFGVKQPVYAAEINWEVLFGLIKRDKFSFKELPRFPEVRRDLALLLDESVSYADLRVCAFKQAKKLLKSVNLFDVYRGDKIPAGKKQYALGFVLQDLEKTLTDQDVERVMDTILKAFVSNFGAQLR
jgi:phenylalanyl-tRNA synthetase beta chain